MTMSTSSAGALTRSAKKLKDLATDAVVLPTPETLYQRKIDEIATTKAELARVVSQIIAAEKEPNSRRPGYADLLAKRQALKEKIDQASREAGLAKEAIAAARPKAPLPAAKQMWADSLPAPTPSPFSKEEMRAAKAELDAVVAKKRAAAWNPREVEALAPAYKEARLKLDFLSGGYQGSWPARRPYGREDMVAALTKWKK
jgi:hypothetical protein